MSQPELVIIAGPNGSGKTTLTRSGGLAEFGIALPTDCQYINADDIALELTGIESPDTREREAFRRARVLRKEYREQRTSFMFETVYSHPSTLLDVQQCRTAGYQVNLLFVT